MSIVFNPKWQRRDPGEFEVLPGNQVEMGPDVGIVTLPEDYVGFMRLSDGLGTRDRDGWFTARFADGTVILALEYLSEFEFLIDETEWNYATFTDRPGALIPKGFVVIGRTENMFDVLLGSDPKSNDFGKVFVWEARKSPWMEGTNTRGLGLVAETFTDFMNGLSARHEL